MRGMEPFADQTALHIGGGDQHGINLACVESLAQVVQCHQSLHVGRPSILA